MRSTKEQAPKAKGVRRNQLLGIFSADENHQKENRINQIKINPCDSVLRDLDANHINRLRDTQYISGKLTV